MKTTVPGLTIQIESQAFEQGFLTASSKEYVGWNIQQPPTEDTVVQFMCDFLDIVNSDLASGHDCDYEVRWCAGLFTGWLLREKV